MARARNIKPAFFKNETLVDLPFEHRLLFVGLWTLADRDGKLEDRPKRIKMEIFPADDVNVEDGLQKLDHFGFVTRYEAEGQKVIIINNFAKHQSPHNTEKASVLPDINDSITVDSQKRHGEYRPESLFIDSLNPSSLNPDSSNPTPAEPASQNERRAKPSKPRVSKTMTQAMQDRFERFYSAYPRKTDRKEAEKAFAKISPDEHLLAQMLASIEKAREAGQFRDLQYTKHPATWLNKGSWMDTFHTSYSDEEIQVIDCYNQALGNLTGDIDPEIFSQSRSGMIQDFLTLSAKPRFWEGFFPWVRDNCDLPPRCGFDWLISREGFTKVKGGQHTRSS